jgi:phosphoserine phosphatase
MGFAMSHPVLSQARSMLLAMGLAALAACSLAEAPTAVPDGLPSWNDGPVKQRIVAFVEEVTDEGAPGYVPPAERIATFDNDGTLWAEQPIYVEIVFALDRVRAMATSHPEWRTEHPYRAVIENDRAAMAKFSEADLFKLIAVTHAGMTETVFDASAKAWFATAEHPRYRRPYTQLVYQPQLELLAYLRAHGFKTFIVSGGELDFMRAFAPAAYGIPPDQIAGTTLRYAFEETADVPAIRRLPEIDINGDNVGKPVNIQIHIGQRPILAFGNSDGDLEMLEYTDAGPGPRLMLILHHDDAVREYAYDRQSRIGHLDKAWDAAIERGWSVVSMKNDFRTVFPPERQP